MVKVTEVYTAANYLNANDIAKPINTTIAGVTVESMKDGKKKIVVVLAGLEKSLVLNKTNAKTLAQKFGEDTNDWAGKEISLAAVPVEFQGAMTKGLRIL